MLRFLGSALFSSRSDYVKLGGVSMSGFRIDISHLPGDKDGTKEEGVERPKDDPISFEEAVALTGQGWFHLKLQLFCGLGLMATIVEMLSTGYALPAAECDLEISTADKGLISAICFVGMLFGSHLWGFLADTRGRRVVLTLTLLCDCVCTLGASLAHTVWLLLIFRFFNGFFICGSAAVLFAYLGEFHCDRTRARAIVWLGMFVAIAIIMLPALAWLVIPLDFALPLPWIEFRAWRLFVLVCAVPGLIAALFIQLFLPRSPKFALIIGEQYEALETLRYIYATNTGNSPDEYPVKSVCLSATARRGSRLGPLPPDPSSLKKQKSAIDILKSMVLQTAPLFRPPHLWANVLSCALEFAILCCANGFLLWMPEIFNRLAQYNAMNPDNGLSVCEAIEAHGAWTSRNSSIQNGSLWNTTEDVQIGLPRNSSETINTLWILEKAEELMAINAVTECSNEVDISTFKNTLVIGGASLLAYTLAGFFVQHIGNRNVLIISMLTSGVAGFGLYFVNTPDLVLGFTCVFIGLATMCVSVVNSILVELFPTNLRAMAVSLALMCGRLGTVVGSLLVGALLEQSCPSVFFMSAGIVFVCGFLGFVIPKNPAPEVMPVT